MAAGPSRRRVDAPVQRRPRPPLEGAAPPLPAAPAADRGRRGLRGGRRHRDPPGHGPPVRRGERHLRRRRGEAGPVPARGSTVRLRAPDPLHDRRRALSLDRSSTPSGSGARRTAKEVGPSALVPAARDPLAKAQELAGDRHRTGPRAVPRRLRESHLARGGANSPTARDVDALARQARSLGHWPVPRRRMPRKAPLLARRSGDAPQLHRPRSVPPLTA